MRALVLSASAGSGKTFRLAYKFVHDTIKYSQSKPYLYRAILAVTFTNKATEQMKSRIIAELDTLSRIPEHSKYMDLLKKDLGLPEQEIIKRAKIIQTRILHDYSHFAVLTIDKFFQRILRSFLKELGYDLNYNIELDGNAILAESIDSLIEDISTNDELRQWIEEYSQECMEDNKSWDIRKTMANLGESIFRENSKSAIESQLSKRDLRQIVGSMMKRAAEAKIEQKDLGCKALAMMAAAGVSPDDFKGRSSGFSSLFVNAAEGGKLSITSVRRAFSQKTEGWSKNPTAQALATELCPMLARIIELEDSFYTLAAIRKNYRSYGVLKDLSNRVREYCNREGVMLLSETRYILSRFIEDNDTPFIYEKMGNRFERFMIDEFQDTSLRDWRNFVPLLRNSMAQSDDVSVLIVGDVKQSIYRWRGGDWRILNEGVAQALGHNDTQVELMKVNYRSLSQIVEFNNDVIGRVVDDNNAQLNAKLKEAKECGSISAQCYVELYDMLLSAYYHKGNGTNAEVIDFRQTVSRVKEKSGYVRVERFKGLPPIIESIESAVARGYKYSDIMILCRDGNDGATVAKILMEYKRQNNTFNIMTQESLVVGQAAVSRFVVAVMRLSQDRDDRISLALVNDYLGRDFDAAAEESDLRFFASIASLSPEQAFERIVMEYGLNDRCDELAYLQAIHEQVVSFCSTKSADLHHFLKMWDEKGSERKLEVERNDDTIELITIHKAKGLEKKVVIIPYCSWQLPPRANNSVWIEPNKDNDELSAIGSFPINYSQEKGRTAFSEGYYRETIYSYVENVNILYVALTRACEELYAFIPSDAEKSSIGPSFWGAVKAISNGVVSVAEEREWVEFGSQQAPATDDIDAAGCQNVMFTEYPTFEQKIHLSLPSQRYFEWETESQSMRNLGITMHAVLSEAKDKDDVMRSIEMQHKNGALSDEQAAELRQIIDREFERELVREWFGEWCDVRTENDIISSGEVGTRRPDRVMISGDRAVVVDYKFGEVRAKSHHRQVAAYMQLLRDMGYARVEGYVWYLTIGHIDRVDDMLNF